MQWKIGDVVAGEVKSGGGLTFAMVEGAGHMVPMDQPEAVSDNFPFMACCELQLLS